jgi:hypothetical protein
MRDSTFTQYNTVPAPLSMQPLTIYSHTNWRSARSDASGNATVPGGLVTLAGEVERFDYAANCDAIIRRDTTPNGSRPQFRDRIARPPLM